MAKIIIHRSTSWADRLRAYRVVLDGQKIGSLKAKETAEYEIAPGEHSLRMGIDWCGSQTINFTLSDGDTKRFACASNLQGLKLFLGFYYTFFSRNNYLMLTELH